MTSEGSTATTTSIETLLDEGKIAFEKKDYETSVTKLGEACHQLDRLNGELDLKNGDAYFLYGRALLGYATKQNTVLGEAEEVENQQTEATTTTDENTNPRFQFDQQPVFESSETAGGSSTVDNNDDGDDFEDGDKEDEQEDDFETAWDVLDVARLIFENGQNDEDKLKLAEVLLCLGDVSLETEKFDAAVPDFKRAIDIKQTILKNDDRQLAEAHYRYALALELSNKSQLALSEIQKAQDVLNNRKANLESGSTQDDTDRKGKGKCTLDEKTQNEIVVINELLSDLGEKMTELSAKQETEREAQELLKNILGGLSNTTGETNTQNITDTTQVNDLSTLIKRKAKEIVDSIPDSKKPKNE